MDAGGGRQFIVNARAVGFVLIVEDEVFIARRFSLALAFAVVGFRVSEVNFDRVERPPAKARETDAGARFVMKAADRASLARGEVQLPTV